MQTMRLIDCLRLMEGVNRDKSRVSFGIKGVKLNRRMRRGGATYAYDKCTLPYELLATSKSQKLTLEKEKVKRKPNHFENATRNIKMATHNDLKKINIWLITHFSFEGVEYDIIH